MRGFKTRQSGEEPAAAAIISNDDLLLLDGARQRVRVGFRRGVHAGDAGDHELREERHE